MEEIIKILLVEDDEVDRMAVRRAFKSAGVKVDITAVGECQSALAQLTEGTAPQYQQGFECVLLDYRLPDGDGLTLVREVRGAGSKVPLVVLTGQGDEETAVELMKAGATDYLPKSKLSPETLSRSVRNAVRIYRAEREAMLAQKQLRESEERYRLVLEGSNDGIWDWDIKTHEIYCNDRLYEIIGWSADQVKVTYDLLCQLLHPDDRQKVSQAVAKHLDDRIELDIEFRLLHASKEYRNCIARGKAWRDERGRPFRMSGILSDITERKRAEESQRFLAEASAILSASLDYEKTLGQLAKLAVPFLADLCIVDIVENAVVRRMGIARRKSRRDSEALATQGASSLLLTIDRTIEAAQHKSERVAGQEEGGRDSDRGRVQYLQHIYQSEHDGQNPIMEVLRTGVTKLVPEVADAQKVENWGLEIEDELREDEELSEISSSPISNPMDFKSYIIVPLLVRERTLGAISLVSIQSERRYSPTDLALAEELARRAALSIENGQLYRETQETSENLRQAILILGEQQQQLRILQQLTNLLNQRLTDLPGLLREMVRAVANTIPGAQFCFIILNNSECDGLVLTVTAGSGAEKLRLDNAFSLKNGLLSKVFATGEAQLFQGSHCESLQLEEVPAAIYAVAINATALRSTNESVKSRRLGVLAIGNWDDENAFDEEDRNLLVAVGEQAAIAIDNARMIKALEEQEERLEAQNEVLAQQNQELEHQRQQLQLNNLQLLEAARLKSQFLATMSHELRTPMNAVIGFSQLLLRQRQHPLMPQQVDMIGRILNNAKHLLALINEILDLSKIESGRLELKLEAFNLVTFVQSICEEIRPLADEKNLGLHLCANVQNTNAINDSTRLRQILVNLLSNGIKFTQRGSVQVDIKEISLDRLVITVKDTGIGIAKDELDHIFEEFRQIDQTTTRKYAGTGLGLAITKSLVDLMQGTITVESQPGQGSTFRIELPRAVKSPDPSSHQLANVSSQLEKFPDQSRLTPTPQKSRSGQWLY
ncbi:MAG TPA: ATP-binding protein [Coleofasciculaceae cyanobacterium]